MQNNQLLSESTEYKPISLEESVKLAKLDIIDIQNASDDYKINYYNRYYQVCLENQITNWYYHINSNINMYNMNIYNMNQYIMNQYIMHQNVNFNNKNIKKDTNHKNNHKNIHKNNNNKNNKNTFSNLETILE
jgi:hypothetical protein